MIPLRLNDASAVRHTPGNCLALSGNLINHGNLFKPTLRNPALGTYENLFMFAL